MPSRFKSAVETPGREGLGWLVWKRKVDLPSGRADVIGWRHFFCLYSTDDICILGSKVTTIGAVLDAKRKIDKTHAANIMYHTLKDDPRDDNPGHQSITVEHKMVWTPQSGAPFSVEGASTRFQQDKIGSAVPSEKWNTLFTSIVWVVSWHDLGLAPVKPQVVLIEGIEIEPDNVLKLEPPMEL